MSLKAVTSQSQTLERDGKERDSMISLAFGTQMFSNSAVAERL